MTLTSKTSFQTMSARQWWFLTFTILVVLPIVLAFAFMNPIFAWYSEQFVEPGIERSLGFKGGELTIHDGPRSFHWYGIISVSPGGPFERAGVQPGDLPIGYQHRTGLITDLQNARGGNVKLYFVNRAAYETGDYRARLVTISVPR